jgi:uncharacterized protein YeaO (DUF488 family)
VLEKAFFQNAVAVLESANARCWKQTRMEKMSISLKRAYEAPSPDDGYRVLVDKLWPRGVSKENAKLDEWKKDIAPSDDLRKQFHDGTLSWGDFRNQYLSELKEYREELRELAGHAAEEKVTLVFGSKDLERNNAVVVKQYLEMLGAG